MTADTQRGRPSILVPCLLAFTSSACVMAVELVAGRLMSRQVGSSIYTWTAVIGVILAGITLGNYVGGILADRWPARRALGVLFSLAAVAVAVIPLLNIEMQFWSRWDLADPNRSWPYRISVHTLMTFLLPASAVGVLGPVVAKMALDVTGSTGSTVGKVYAWGAFGSIVGTFVAGFFLIEWLGCEGVLLIVTGVLAILGLAISIRPAATALIVTWPLVAACVAVISITPPNRFQAWTLAGGRLSLQESVQPETIYKKESQYSYLRVLEIPGQGTRQLFLDNLIHAICVPGEPTRLEYEYEKMYAAVTERFGRSRADLRALFLGGGGYVFPRYVRALWPASRVKVSEIDPAVTEANFEAFGLNRDEVLIVDREGEEPVAGAGAHPFQVFHMDAKIHVDDILRMKEMGGKFEPFDFIYGDAFSDFSIPHHLVTREFTAKVRDLLRPDGGIYLLNVIEIYDSGRFLGALLNTLEAVFTKVYILSPGQGGPNEDPTGRETYILVATFRDIDLSDLGRREGGDAVVGTPLDAAQLETLRRRSGGVVLSDDYSPVENLLEAVVRRRGIGSSGGPVEGAKN